MLGAVGTGPEAREMGEAISEGDSDATVLGADPRPGRIKVCRERTFIWPRLG